MKLTSGSAAKRGLVLAFCLALMITASPASAQLSPQARLESLQEQLFEFLQKSDYPGVLAVVREIRSLELPVPESVLYAEGLSLLAIGRAQEAEWLLANHLDQAGPDSLFHREIRELYEAARKAAGSAPAAAPATTGQTAATGATGQAATPMATGQSPTPTVTGQSPTPTATGQSPTPTATGQSPTPTATGQSATPMATGQPSTGAGASPSEARAPSQPTGQADRNDSQAALAQPYSGNLPEGIATEWELENKPDAREWTRIRYGEDPRQFEDFIARYPESRFASSAAQRQDSVIKAMGRRGYESYRKGDYDAARQIWLEAADYANDYAQTMLGFLYDQGLGVTPDAQEAVRWFEMAAEQGNATAQTNLGVLYYEGRGVTQDSGRALEWLLRGAEQGDQAAQVRIGTLYQYGRGNVAQDLDEARRWFRLAAEQGSEQAAEQLRLLGGQ